ncbi:MAG: 23S rRNA (adenine(2503)-C(2))-methyltransferase RlmN [Chthoniobacterales bacterium]
MSLLDLTYIALREKMPGLHESHTRTLWRALYRENATDLAGHPDFLPPLKKWFELHSTLQPQPPMVVHETQSSDGHTRKVLLQLADGHRIETVLMGFTGRFTACLSTQVGCAMGCVFCATGQMGFTRHLTPGEIVAQVLHQNRRLRENGQGQLRNLVLMGMGEPLHNYDAVMTALEILSDTRGANIGPTRISISTVGVVPGIIRLAEENRPYNLAVSLHGATQEERAQLVPTAKKWPLDQLMDACRFYTAKTERHIFFEWTLIEDTNDSPEQAEALARLLENMPAHINLIPLNPTEGYAGEPSSNAMRFKSILRAAGFPTTIRQRRGIDVAAGCGQLAIAG